MAFSYVRLRGGHRRLFYAADLQSRGHLPFFCRKNPRTAERLNALTQGACIPLHPGRSVDGTRKDSDLSIHSSDFIHNQLSPLELPPEIRDRAHEIARLENEKLQARDIEGEWIDGEKLAVQLLVVSDQIRGHQMRLSFEVSVLRWSEILALKDIPFDRLAAWGALHLDTNTHVVAKENKHRVLILAKRGNKPGDPRMGEELFYPSVGDRQWTLATNGTIDAATARSVEFGGLVWEKSVLAEAQQELGLEMLAEKSGKPLSLSYVGVLLDTSLFVGTISILGAIYTSLPLRAVEEAWKSAPDRSEIEQFDTIPMECDAVARYLREHRARMLPELVTGLVLLGYNHWGERFLRKADR